MQESQRQIAPWGLVGHLRSLDDLFSEPICLFSTSVFCKPSIPSNCYAWHCLLSTSAEWLVCPLLQHKAKHGAPGRQPYMRRKPETVHLCFPPSPACSLRGKREPLGLGTECALSTMPSPEPPMATGLWAQFSSEINNLGF